MTNITHCPACHTQFVVTDEQLSQHHGKVRCGQCLNVFDASQALVDAEVAPEINADTPVSYHETTNVPTAADEQTQYFESQLTTHKPKTGANFWLMWLLITLLCLAAILQSLYFLRSPIAANYPKLKPYLVLACEKIHCNIDLPKKIELIVIDDSDMQEDATYQKLIHLSSTLMNQANFSQAYPNIELTLTDTEDQAKLRRIFKPEEYLPANTDIASGLAANADIKVKLAITADELVAGYRIAVSY